MISIPTMQISRRLLFAMSLSGFLVGLFLIAHATPADCDCASEFYPIDLEVVSVTMDGEPVTDSTHIRTSFRIYGESENALVLAADQGKDHYAIRFVRK